MGSHWEFFWGIIFSTFFGPLKNHKKKPVLARNGKRVQYLPWDTSVARIQTKSFAVSNAVFSLHVAFGHALRHGLGHVLTNHRYLLCLKHIWGAALPPNIAIIVFWSYLDLQQAPG